MQQPSTAVVYPNLEQGVEKHAEVVDQDLNEDRTGYIPHESTVPLGAAAPPMMHSALNGSMEGPAPPVYVSAPLLGHPHHHHMLGMEQQFRQFGLHPDHVDQMGSSAHDSSENNDTEHNEGDESDEEPVKLFVGQVRTLTLVGF